MPERFAPAGALSIPTQAAGRAPRDRDPGRAPTCSPLSSRDPGSGPQPRSGHARLGPGAEPVQISVTGAEALAARRPDPPGARVDVIVTTEPGPGGGRGRTYVAASGVRLLALLAGSATAAARTTRGRPRRARGPRRSPLPARQALRLIQAENFARGVRLIAS